MFPGKGGISQPPLQQREVHDILVEGASRTAGPRKAASAGKCGPFAYCLSLCFPPNCGCEGRCSNSYLSQWGSFDDGNSTENWAAERQKSVPNNQITKQPHWPWLSVLHPQNWVWRLAHSRGSVRICWINKMNDWMHACSVTQLWPTLCNPVDCSPPGSSFHGIFQARILARVAISFSRRSYGSYRPRVGACVSMTIH